MASKRNRVKVLVRIRPSQQFPSDIFEIGDDNKILNIHLPKDSKRAVVDNKVLDWQFKTDGVFFNVSQDKVYDSVGADLINAGLNGYNGTIMCYGQTGAGKTFTMTGATEAFHNRGIVPRALSHLYSEINNQNDLAVSIRISYLEIYNEQMFDLLATLPESQSTGAGLVVVEEGSGVYVKGLSCHLAQTEEEALELLFEGETNRATAAHTMNKRSSRSHTILTVYIETRSRFQSNAQYTVAKLNFVDLAGSERLQKTHSTGRIQQEAAYINKSLTFLEQTVIALAEKGRDHIPYRQSKLTHYLKDSIGGNCKTILIANIWGEEKQVDETASTLRFAARMMCVTTDPIENKQYDPAILVKNLQGEISNLKRELAMHDTLNNRSHITYEALSEQQKYDIRQQVRQFVNGELDELDIVNVRQIQETYVAFKDLYKSLATEVEERALGRGPLTNGTDLGATDSAVGLVDSQGLAHSTNAFNQGKRDENSMVGDSDGRSFGIGHASTNLLEENGPYLQGKRKEQRRRAAATAANTSSGKMPPGGSVIGMTGEGIESPLLAGDGAVGDPPGRSAAFEEFKKDVGSELYRVLTENKGVLTGKKKDYSNLANHINSIKTEIDSSRLRLEALRREREAEGSAFTEDGEQIISEEEFVEIRNLRELKMNYKKEFEDLKNIKSHVAYCQKMVDLTRQRLIQEFDKWYTESFLDASVVMTSIENGFGQRPGTLQQGSYEDPIDRFDRMKSERFSSAPENEPYNRAKESAARRHIYTDYRKQQPPLRRQPGTPVLNLRQQPPNSLEMLA